VRKLPQRENPKEYSRKIRASQPAFGIHYNNMPREITFKKLSSTFQTYLFTDFAEQFRFVAKDMEEQYLRKNGSI